MMQRTRLSLTVILSLLPLVGHAQVPYQRLVDAAGEPQNWLTYSGTYRSERFSQLTEITPDNVSSLRVAWAYQVVPSNIGGAGIVETTPLVVDGIMYLTEPRSTVTALDARTGRKLWSWSPAMAEDVLHVGFPAVNRGVAILGNTVFVGTLDAHLVALDATTGALRWDTVVADNRIGFSITSAPLAIKDRIIIGVSGAEAGVRGFVDAYDAATGALAWRFWTVPAPGEPGSETWGGESWRTGGGSTWLSGSFDPDLNLLYWMVGNPAPDWNGDDRPGDNLYTCSILALDPATGNRRWHFQFTPHDTHDWDANQIPVLFDAPIAGRDRKLVAVANRNAFYYVLDRETGEFLRATAFAKQTWADGFSATGRPIVRPGSVPTETGVEVWPSLEGATNWFSPSFHPMTRQFFVAVRHMGSIFYKAEAEYQPGKFFLGGGQQAFSGDAAWGFVKALDALTGETQWEFRLLTPPWAGVMATAGGLVFGGDNEGNVFALDAGSGRPLWNFQAGARVQTNPMSFAIDGRQHIVTAAGRTIFVFGLP